MPVLKHTFHNKVKPDSCVFLNSWHQSPSTPAVLNLSPKLKNWCVTCLRAPTWVYTVYMPILVHTHMLVDPSTPQSGLLCEWPKSRRSSGSPAVSTFKWQEEHHLYPLIGMGWEVMYC